MWKDQWEVWGNVGWHPTCHEELQWQHGWCLLIRSANSMLYCAEQGKEMVEYLTSSFYQCLCCKFMFYSEVCQEMKKYNRVLEETGVGIIRTGKTSK